MFKGLADIFASKLSPNAIAWLYENTPPAALRQLQMQRFRQTVRFAAKHSQFYRERFAEHGIDASRVKRPADLGDFFTTPLDVAEHAEQMICRPASIVFESSGTSGRNKRVYYDTRELHSMGVCSAGGLRMMGVKPGYRVANAFDFSIWIPGWINHYGLMAAGKFRQAFR